MATYDIGDPVTVTASFTLNGAPADPTTVTATVRSPSGVLTTPNPTHDGVGEWHAQINAVDETGEWSYKFVGTGAVAAVETGSFEVIPSVFDTAGTWLTTIGRARAYLRAPDADETLLSLLVGAYTKAIRQFCRREFTPRVPAADSGQPVTKSFRYSGGGFLDLAPYELRSLGGAPYAGTGGIVVFADQPAAYQQTVSDVDAATEAVYRLEPRGGTTEGTYLSLALPPITGSGLGYYQPPTHLSGVFGYEVAVTGYWGMTAVPADVEMACLIAVSDGYRNPEGVASRTLDSLSYVETIEPADAPGRALPPDARALLAPYRRLDIALV